jgi:hypothetical protein
VLYIKYHSQFITLPRTPVDFKSLEATVTAEGLK